MSEISVKLQFFANLIRKINKEMCFWTKLITNSGDLVTRGYMLVHTNETFLANLFTKVIKEMCFE